MDRTRDRTGRYIPGTGLPSVPRPDAGFAPPPPGAPHEISTGGITSPHPMQQGGTIAPPPDILGQPPALPLAPAVQPAMATPTSAAGRSLGVALSEDALRQPARSDTDTPSRGLPRPPQPGKAITGGFGLPSGPEYYALDGSELRTVVLALAGRLKSALDGDLRFGLSVVYPQVKVTLRLTVDGRPPDQRARDQGNTEQAPGKESLEWSRILSLDAEVEDSDSTPAGKIRDDFDLPSPGKRLVKSGATRLLVDG